MKAAGSGSGVALISSVLPLSPVLPKPLGCGDACVTILGGLRVRILQGKYGRRMDKESKYLEENVIELSFFGVSLDRGSL